jgi:hypothetical protein
VELLQQIASNTFAPDDILRDDISGQSQPIKEWEEFAPFAEQAQLKREVVAEERQVAIAVKKDKRGGVFKAVIGVSVVAALAVVLAVWFFTRKGTRNERVAVDIDTASGVDVNGQLIGTKGQNKPGMRGFGPGKGGAPGTPGYSGGTSFESILNNNNEEIVMGQSSTPDLTRAQLAAPLARASFISACGAPDDMKVTVQVAVQNGRAIGVTVGTNPPNPGVAACIDRSVRGLAWPSSPKKDFVTTSY